MTTPLSYSRAASDRAAAVRRAAHALAQDILIGARVIELRRLAEQTSRGELPVPDDDPRQDGD